MSAALYGGLGALLGAVAGAQPDQSSQNSVNGIRLAPESELEKLTGQAQTDQFKSLQDLFSRGPGAADVDAAYTGQKSLIDMLTQYSQSGGLPSSSDFSTANTFAGQVFQPQQLAMQNAFGEQRIQADRLAAQLGRQVDDPVIRAKMMQEQTRQQAGLAAEQGSYAAQFAQNLPMQRLSFMQDATNMRSNLANQALSNRQMLLGLGSQLQTQERNWRLQTGERYGNTSSSSGGGLKGAIEGGLGGAGAGMSMAGAMQNYQTGGLQQKWMQQQIDNNAPMLGNFGGGYSLGANFGASTQPSYFSRPGILARQPMGRQVP